MQGVQCPSYYFISKFIFVYIVYVVKQQNDDESIITIFYNKFLHIHKLVKKKI